jgi:dephospho-CoA kinase
MPKRPSIDVGLTGGIATGKSAALAEFKRLGAETISMDEITHELLGEPKVAARVARRFGRDVLDSKGRVDRKALGAKVFGRRSELTGLERILHPLIRRRSEQRLAKSRRAIRVVDVPLLFEKDLQREYDVTMLVYAKPAVQSRRLKARDGMSAAEAARRIRLQWPIDRKVELADVVLDNGGSLPQLRRRVGEYYKAFELLTQSGEA